MRYGARRVILFGSLAHMTSPEMALAERIRDEIVELDRVVARAAAAWEHGKVSADQDYYLDAVALNLHGFYSGVEFVCLTEHL